MDFQRHLLFPSQVVSLQLDNFYLVQTGINAYAYALKENDPQGQHFTNRGGWHSTFEHTEDFVPYEKYVQGAIQKAVGLYGFNSETQIELANMWFIINSPGTFNVSHLHPSSNLSGVLYCKVPRNSGNIVFENDRVFPEANLLTNLLPEMQAETKMTHSFSITPKSGMILLFPSHLRHEVQENTSDEDRVVLSFNLNVR